MIENRLKTSLFCILLIISMTTLDFGLTVHALNNSNVTADSQDDYYVQFNATEEDYVNFSSTPSFTADKSWTIVQRIKTPENPTHFGWSWFRGSAWEDKEGDIALKLNSAEITKYQIVFWIRKDGWNKLLMAKDQDGVAIQNNTWYNIVVRFSKPESMYELYLNGDLVDSLELEGMDDTDNQNPLFFGGQYCEPQREKGDLYSECDTAIAHLAWYQRALSSEEIEKYDGSIDNTDEDLFFATKITGTEVQDASGNERNGINGNSPEYIKYPEKTIFPPLALVSLGIIATLTVIRKKRANE